MDKADSALMGTGHPQPLGLDFLISVNQALHAVDSRYRIDIHESGQAIAVPVPECVSFALASPSSATQQPDWKTAALLKDRTRRAIRERRQLGETVEALALDYGVPVRYVEALCAWQMFGDDLESAAVWPLVEQVKALEAMWRTMVANAFADGPIPNDETGHAARWTAVEYCADELAAVFALLETPHD